MIARDAAQVEAFDRLAMASMATTVLASLSIATTVVGALALVLDGALVLLWLATSLLAAALAAGAGSVVAFRRWFALLGAPPERRQVFISYHTAEHADAAELLLASLSRAGLPAFWAPPDGLEVADLQGVKPLAALKLFQTAGLDAMLQSQLLASHSLVFFERSRTDRVRWLARMREFYDAVLAQVRFCSGLTQTFWRYVYHGLLYNRPISPAALLPTLSSWQSWELLVARQLDLVVVRVRLAEEEGEPPSAAGGDDPIACRRARLAEDLDAKVVPRLQGAVRERWQPSMLVPALMVSVAGMMVVVAGTLLAVAGAGLYLAFRALI